MAAGHRPVLLAEALELLDVRPGGFYVDGTVGLGGHASEILRRSAPGGRLLALDRDPEALEEARRGLAGFGGSVTFAHADYRQIPALVAGERPNGILLDLGVSSLQLDTPERGFSFRAEGPLDMRMDRSHGTTAEEIVNRWSEADLADVIFRFGEERYSRRIARAVCAQRRSSRIKTTAELAGLVRRAVPRGRPGLDPATRTFQALRITVNQELDGLGAALQEIARTLAVGGRLCVISFHSLEDREAKLAFRSLGAEGFRVLTKKPLRPGPGEVHQNPRSRSARLRGLLREAA